MLVQPQSMDIDYDLYLFDTSTGQELDKSINSTYLNGKATLQETVGYVNNTTAPIDCQIYVLSAQGGSSTEPYQLLYSFSDVYDSYESIGGNNINKSLLLDLEEFYAKGYINNASLHSPIDIDCFAIDIPENSEFEYLELSVNDNGGNTCEIQVYQDVTGYQHMQLLSFGSKVKLTANAGRYYIRIVPINTFDLSKITNYEFSMNKILPYFKSKESSIFKGFSDIRIPKNTPRNIHVAYK